MSKSVVVETKNPKPLDLTKAPPSKIDLLLQQLEEKERAKKKEMEDRGFVTAEQQKLYAMFEPANGAKRYIRNSKEAIRMRDATESKDGLLEPEQYR